MSIVYVTSDWHLGHKNQVRWRSEFSDHTDVASLLIENYCKTVRKRDIVWFLGDMIVQDKEHWLEKLKKLPGEKRLVLGNHDTDSSTRPTILELSEVFTQIHALVKYKDVWLSHAPIHESELRGKINIHGHTHYAIVDDTRYYNVCPELNNYEVVAYQEIIGRIGK